ncbi:MAG TPA: EutN/CcmL family microcompartment protein [Myxococcota bacterium]|nr:EutN/CcmL family microcompartment protein [Myxococcota bacterium]HOC98789.1 EutN/CcmL family microcompartment protein [Myxococcota bacterium]HOH77615.1 EutN/CcmL family microcompartment protein [Myxococcota bacterium]
MILGRIAGTVVSTVKHPEYVGHKLLVVQPIDPTGRPNGESFLAVDDVQAGVGDTVLVIREGNGARQIFKRRDFPIRAVIVGIVDDVNIPEGDHR